MRDAGQSVAWEVATTLREVSVERLARSECVLIETGTPDATWQALRTVRARAPELPVVVLTRSQDPDTAARLLRLGAQDCLVKPRTDGHALSRAIRFAVVRQRLLAAQRRHAAHDLLLHDDVIQRLFAIGLALQTTQQRSTGQPDLADRIDDHLDALHQVVQLVRSTSSMPNSRSEGPRSATTPPAGALDVSA